VHFLFHDRRDRDGKFRQAGAETNNQYGYDGFADFEGLGQVNHGPYRQLGTGDQGSQPQYEQQPRVVAPLYKGFRCSAGNLLSSHQNEHINEIECDQNEAFRTRYGAVECDQEQQHRGAQQHRTVLENKSAWQSQVGDQAGEAQYKTDLPDNAADGSADNDTGCVLAQAALDAGIDCHCNFG